MYLIFIDSPVTFKEVFEEIGEAKEGLEKFKIIKMLFFGHLVERLSKNKLVA